MSGPFRHEKKNWTDDSPIEVEAKSIVNGSQRSCANVAKGRLRPVRSIAADDHICLPGVTGFLSQNYQSMGKDH